MSMIAPEDNDYYWYELRVGKDDGFLMFRDIVVAKNEEDAFAKSLALLERRNYSGAECIGGRIVLPDRSKNVVLQEYPHGDRVLVEDLECELEELFQAMAVAKNNKELEELHKTAKVYIDDIYRCYRFKVKYGVAMYYK